MKTEDFLTECTAHYEGRKNYFPERAVPNISSHSEYHISLSGPNGATRSEEVLTLLTIKQTYNVNSDNLECHPKSPLIWLGYILGKWNQIDPWYPPAFLPSPVRPDMDTALKPKLRQTVEQKQATAKIRANSGNYLKF